MEPKTLKINPERGALQASTAWRCMLERFFSLWGTTGSSVMGADRMTTEEVLVGWQLVVDRQLVGGRMLVLGRQLSSRLPWWGVFCHPSGT